MSADEDGTPKLIGKGDNSSLDSRSSDLSDDKINTMTQETPLAQSSKSGKGGSHHYASYQQSSKRKPTTKSAMMSSIVRDLMTEDSPVIPQIAKPTVSHRAQKSKKGASETAVMPLSQETKKRKEKERTKERERLEKTSHKEGRGYVRERERERDEHYESKRASSYHSKPKKSEKHHYR